MLRVLIRSCGVLVVMFSGLIMVMGVVGERRQSDLLVYAHFRGSSPLMLFDPSTAMQVRLTQPFKLSGIQVSAKGHIAFSTDEYPNEIYVWDKAGTPTNIGVNLGVHSLPLGWSPDGRYLVLVSRLYDKRRVLYIWDGTKLTNISPDELADDLQHYDIAWSLDGWLAFIVHHFPGDFSQGSRIFVWDYHQIIEISPNSALSYYGAVWGADGRLAFIGTLGRDRDSEVYVWDRRETINISQNPMGKDTNPVWSADGRLAFTGTLGQGSEVYVWDGRETLNISQNPMGMDANPVWSVDGRLAFTSRNENSQHIMVWNGDFPSTHTTIQGYQAVYSPKWLKNGYLTFSAQPLTGGIEQIYWWDGKNVTDLSQNPGMENLNPTWREDGVWAFNGIYRGRDMLIYVRDADNQPLLTVEGRRPVWNAEGYLIFCRLDSQKKWVLSMWDGGRVVEITQSLDIWAVWKSGSVMRCTSW
jgi:hypothetical protein